MVLALPGSSVHVSLERASGFTRPSKRWGSPAGRAYGACLGFEESLKHWAQQVQVSPESASGVLIGALGMLEAHYALP